MPTGVYERSTEQKERLRKMVKIIAPLVPKGTHLSPKTEFGKGAEPWNKGKEWPEMRGENHPSRNPEHRAIFEKIWGQPKTYWSGADHPCWKGGKTPLIMKIRNSQQCADWRVAIFKRDKYTCRVCGDNRGHNLNAHHYRQLADMDSLVRH